MNSRIVAFLKHIVEELGQDALQGIFDGFRAKHNLGHIATRDLAGELAEAGIVVQHPAPPEPAPPAPEPAKEA